MTPEFVGARFSPRCRAGRDRSRGEQPSASYSIVSRRHAVSTQRTNIGGKSERPLHDANMIPDAHLVKLGTMGEYGTPNIDIEEGYIEIEHKGRKGAHFRSRSYPGWRSITSRRFTTPTTSRLRVHIWGLAATDLNQGVVYGIRTDKRPWMRGFAHVPITTRPSAPF